MIKNISLEQMQEFEMKFWANVQNLLASDMTIWSYRIILKFTVCLFHSSMHLLTSIYARGVR